MSHAIEIVDEVQKDDPHANRRGRSPTRNLPSAERRRLLPTTLSQGVQEMRYDVRGEVYLAAQRRLAEGKDVIFTNVGNPHAMGEKPLTFPRQVAALCACPWMFQQPEVLRNFPEDAVRRAQWYLSQMKGGIGAYSDSRGHTCVRQEVADFITKRDSPAPAASAEDVFLTNGAGAAVSLILQAMIRGKSDCVLAPIPQYPLYSASVAQFGGTLLGYHLNEDASWGLSVQNIAEIVGEARQRGKCVRALVLINPGNPTGSCLSSKLLCEVLSFASREGIVVIADEVYQENVYQPAAKPFVSCRSVLHSLGEPWWSQTEVFSLHSISKGASGECGWRGGYLQMMNIDPGTVDHLYKVASVQLSPSVPSQILIGIMCNPPQPGDASYVSHLAEKEEIIASLKRRALRMSAMFNSLEGTTCECPEGAMYAFPRIRLPPAAVDAAQAEGKTPDLFYALALLKETGISTVPGSGFGQADGTYHIRTTFLAPEIQMDRLEALFRDFHASFMSKYQVPLSRL